MSPRATDNIVAALSQTGSEQDAETRTLAITALAKVAPESALARDALLAALDDPDSSVQFAAAKSLLELDATIEAPRAVVLAQIRQVNPRAIILVAELRERGSWAQPALRQLVNHRDKSVRDLARHALERVTTR